ncbi:GNAT family N-acetyltransferase [Riemerella anatipestifer]|uniref:GNAT family N-acetyltransferase n=1 Tax=Riemerella anatipestifer TaxID=34085 RepID=UPI00129D81F4|nr:GNAT family N-acetyltransferase [Riemerella anatipestifer]MBT0549776.1 GNAT family N-acetyltransferase [Riemerella anatipestifer]MBT0556017.1 GNAT family N-acetyltransferase [Riemerella anatipestifer]MBT0560539.1 GNAT family N-acetyltransferase [Riemerella anatipestifer]MCO7354551.1 GNAT family N-acetyltransferase [Riemerella anatipestifer]MDY3524152.1 GNAT family N-acetyltransferase [Riemerella anatipestifer]
MKAKLLEWDTDFFGVNVGAIDDDNDKNDLLELSFFDVLVIKQKRDISLDIEGFQKTFQETKVIFEKKLEEGKEVQATQIKIFDTDETNVGWESFRKLAYESGKMSRFRLDSRFGVHKFQELYDQWIINSLNKKFAIKTFYVVDGKDVPIAFVTLQRGRGTIGKIGLIATCPDYQGKGIGKKMLQKVERYCQENNISTLEIPTQEENSQACAFYAKMDYVVKERQVIKHYWKK